MRAGYRRTAATLAPVATTVFLITGIPGAGKTTVALALAGRFERAAHVEADALQRMIVSGGRWPHEGLDDVARAQLGLRARNAGLLAASFFDAGIVPVIDDIVVGPRRLGIYREVLGERTLQLVVLAPPVEVALARDRGRRDKQVGDRWVHLDAEQRAGLGNEGVWLDTGQLTVEQTVDAILERAP